MKRALYVGSFDPPTHAHLDIIERSSLLCDELFVCIGINIFKSESLLSAEQRFQLLTELVKHKKNVKIVMFEGLIADFAKQNEINFFIRGLRSIDDFESEYSRSVANRELSQIETLFLMSRPQFRHISSSLVREIYKWHGNIDTVVPLEVQSFLQHISK